MSTMTVNPTCEVLSYDCFVLMLGIMVAGASRGHFAEDWFLCVLNCMKHDGNHDTDTQGNLRDDVGDVHEHGGWPIETWGTLISVISDS